MSRDAIATRAPQVDSAIARLHEGTSALASRPRAATLDALCEVLEVWRQADSPYRKELEARLPEVSGFNGAMVTRGLNLALAEWTGEALRDLARSELPEVDRDACVGHATTGVVLAGSIPMPSLLASILPLLLHSPTLVKSASRDPVTPELVARSIAEVDPLLGRCIEVVSFPRNDEDAARAFFAVPCINATGSDDSLAQMSDYLAPHQRFIAHGHKSSIALIGPHDESDTGEIAQALALDVSLWDQLGCLSATQIFVVGEKARQRAQRLAEAVASELEVAEIGWPRGSIDRETAGAIVHERSQLEMRLALGKDVMLWGGADNRYTVVLEEEATLRTSPLHRFIRVVPVASQAALFETLQPIARHVAGVALAGFADAAESVGNALMALGASRICAPGRLQAPPLAWRRDNQDLLIPMLRRVD